MTKLDEATLTSQGQISIPKKVRERLHLEKGNKVIFLEDEKGQIVIQEAETPIEFSRADWDKFLAKTQKEPVTRTHGKKEALRHLDKLTHKK